METLTANGYRACRMHPDAVYLRDLGYVFIDLNGRLYRMDEPEFEALRANCIAGVAPERQQAFGGLLEECGSPQEAAASFARQELSSHES